MRLESFAHEQNIPASHKNVPVYLECTQNSVRIFRMHFDCQRMHYEISFRRHSGSFRHSCVCPFTLTEHDHSILSAMWHEVVCHSVDTTRSALVIYVSYMLRYEMTWINSCGFALSHIMNSRSLLNNVAYNNMRSIQSAKVRPYQWRIVILDHRHARVLPCPAVTSGSNIKDNVGNWRYDILLRKIIPY